MFVKPAKKHEMNDTLNPALLSHFCDFNHQEPAALSLLGEIASIIL
jgi:hypothetical protein